MWLSRCTHDFTLEEDNPLTLVWVLLPKLPFHLHTLCEANSQPYRYSDAYGFSHERLQGHTLYQCRKLEKKQQEKDALKARKEIKAKNKEEIATKDQEVQKIYKPIGAIFGIDKPHPTNEVTNQDKGKEKVLDHNLVPKRRKELTFHQIKQLCRRGPQIRTTKEISTGKEINRV
ncbi:hypothetical protein H5410_061442 [Solanum commersonii]|uniref:DUF4283 domain-containing protein n=1 Tax=Solanum commersonii TaxID=4109 RepID=A0A9J5W8V9_SOLCO|nr:hypothetical protein H5410_061442 [Solanum commersonii]